MTSSGSCPPGTRRSEPSAEARCYSSLDCASETLTKRHKIRLSKKSTSYSVTVCSNMKSLPGSEPHPDRLNLQRFSPQVSKEEINTRAGVQLQSKHNSSSSSSTTRLVHSSERYYRNN